MDGAEIGSAKGVGNAPGGGMQQMLMMEEQVRLIIENGWQVINQALLFGWIKDNFIAQRSNAIETIESTIAELGTIFTQLAGMVAEQRETVQRIDADVSDISK